MRGGAAHGPPRRGAVRVPRARSTRRCSGPSSARSRRIVNVVGMSKMTPPVKDLLPRLTPILKNRHEKVQENCIDLVGRDRRPRRRVRPRARVDAHLLRAARDAQGARRRHPPRDGEHLWVHRESHRAAGRPRDAAEQPEGAGAAEPRVHDRRDRHRRGDVLARSPCCPR